MVTIKTDLWFETQNPSELWHAIWLFTSTGIPSIHIAHARHLIKYRPAIVKSAYKASPMYFIPLELSFPSDHSPDIQTGTYSSLLRRALIVMADTNILNIRLFHRTRTIIAGDQPSPNLVLLWHFRNYAKTRMQ